MGIDKRLLEILCCPVTHTPVRPASRAQLEELNRRIGAGGVLTVSGTAVGTPLDDALITVDNKVLYRIEDGIPVMLPDEGIGTTQFENFPA